MTISIIPGFSMLFKINGILGVIIKSLRVEYKQQTIIWSCTIFKQFYKTILLLNIKI